MQECKYPSYKNDWHTPPCSVNSRCQCSHRSDMPPESETASRAFDDYKPNWLSDKPTPASWSICADDWHLCVLLLATVHTQGVTTPFIWHIIHTRWQNVGWIWVNSSCLGRGIWWIRSELGLKWWEVHGFANKFCCVTVVQQSSVYLAIRCLQKTSVVVVVLYASINIWSFE